MFRLLTGTNSPSCLSVFRPWSKNLWLVWSPPAISHTQKQAEQPDGADERGSEREQGMRALSSAVTSDPVMEIFISWWRQTGLQRPEACEQTLAAKGRVRVSWNQVSRELSRESSCETCGEEPRHKSEATVSLSLQRWYVRKQWESRRNHFQKLPWHWNLKRRNRRKQKSN